MRRARWARWRPGMPGGTLRVFPTRRTPCNLIARPGYFRRRDRNGVARARRGIQRLETGKLLDFTVDLLKTESHRWFQGGWNSGPRALGNRSILGDARSTKYAVG